MSYIMFLFLFGFTFGVVVVAVNPSPYFGALGLVVAAGLGCAFLASHGGSFLSLVLFLIYLGGMLVVFAYSAALAAEPFPEGLGSRRVALSALLYVGGVGLASSLFWGGWYKVFWQSAGECAEFFVYRGDTGGVALMYSSGGQMLLIGAWVLLLTLFVVLELTRGLSRGALRAV
uniref:NADH-ubiquinone oxidoreductase chain 6 n=1 Tax=Lophiodes caulinaris TaxID=314249 RepID=D3KR79_LOPCA|nr:NADH dehydrogenase subunit 6 [Lophiodes caulinaris]BAI76966.1 NADH dehydrogenase subunit 6 [Lophiodes caulinaris]